MAVMLKIQAKLEYNMSFVLTAMNDVRETKHLELRPSL